MTEVSTRAHCEKRTHGGATIPLQWNADNIQVPPNLKHTDFSGQSLSCFIDTVLANAKPALPFHNVLEHTTNTRGPCG